ncbi:MULTISPECIES: sigma-70 family RNA polymerase sigma factor [Lactococcus]|uniref:Uncharacterized protein n=1 Tax=Lactococcus termiticola TaxID=2169526 RepID=A0A2R5HHF1_9LACT|nr:MULTISPECIES: sigma-70 family RNA polymerase sigma factor [Lactococcus]GBG97469.1 hypothetical protein NtB2_01615 [Lactococcus termiticola]
MSKKIEDKRDEKIDIAAKRGDWVEVLKLLDQPLLNAERNDRRHGILSTNWVIDRTGGSSVELENILPDNTLNPLESLIQKEEQAERLNPIQVIQTFDDFEQHLLLGRLLEKKSFAQLARELGRDGKTIRKYFDSAQETLISLLK